MSSLSSITTFQERRRELLSQLEKNIINVHEYTSSMKELEKEEESDIVNPVRCLMLNFFEEWLLILPFDIYSLTVNVA